MTAGLDDIGGRALCAGTPLHHQGGAAARPAPCSAPGPDRPRPGAPSSKTVLYTEFGVGVETDGAAAHPPEARWRDQHRDNAAHADGIVTLRYSWADVTQRPLPGRRAGS